MPGKKSVISQRLEDYSILCFGRKKIGKSSMFAEAPNAFFLPTEPGTKSLSVYQPLRKDGSPKVIKTWPEFVGYADGWLEDRTYGPCVVDTVDIAYSMCFHHMCRHVLHIEHPHDANDYGKSWSAITDEFMGVMRLLMSDGRGCVLISHVKEREVKDKIEGTVEDKIQCSLTGKIHELVTGAIDIWGYYTYRGDERRMYLLGNEVLDVGVRPKHNFLDSKTGEKLEYIPMGNSSEEAYENLRKAFANEITLTDRQPARTPRRRRLRLKKGGRPKVR